MNTGIVEGTNQQEWETEEEAKEGSCCVTLDVAMGMLGIGMLMHLSKRKIFGTTLQYYSMFMTALQYEFTERTRVTYDNIYRWR